MRHPRAVVTIIGITLSASVALALFPPWNAQAIRTDRITTLLNETDLRLMAGGTKVEYPPVVVADTLAWSVPFAAVLNPPLMQQHLWQEPLDRLVDAVRAASGDKSKLPSDSAIELAMKQSNMVKERLARRLRVPLTLLAAQPGMDTTFFHVQLHSREVRYAFVLATARLVIEVAAILMSGAAIAVVVAFWPSSHSGSTRTSTKRAI